MCEEPVTGREHHERAVELAKLLLTTDPDARERLLQRIRLGDRKLYAQVLAEMQQREQS